MPGSPKHNGANLARSRFIPARPFWSNPFGVVLACFNSSGLIRNFLIRSNIYAVRPIDKEQQDAIVSLEKGQGPTLAEKREMSMWGLIIASGVCGLLFGRYFKMYALIPAALVLVGISYFWASKQGLAFSVLSLVLATVAMQLCYFLSVMVTLFIDNFEPAKAPSEEFL